MTLVVAAVVILAFAVGVTHLFTLRFQRGDIYPAYSSLRSDPLGTKVLFKSIGTLDAVSIQRNHEPLERIGSPGRTTLFFLGANVSGVSFLAPTQRNAFQRIAVEGGRLVFSFQPVRPLRMKKSVKNKEEKTEPRTQTGEEGDESDTPCPRAVPGEPSDADGTDRKESPGKEIKKPLGHSERYVSLPELWGVTLEYDDADKDKKTPGEKAVSHLDDLPNAVSWHTALYFKPVKKGWKTIYSHKDRPVIIERNYGRGSVVLSADSYLFSNEALRNERRPELLAWFIGENLRVIFDESHFGIRKNRGVADLVRKYRLAGLFAGIAVLALLFVWKNSSSLVPPATSGTDDDENQVASDKDSTAGMVSLLRRNIPPKTVLTVGFKEWKRSVVRKGKPLPPDQLNRINRILGGATAKDFDPVQAYRRIVECLDKRYYGR